MGINASRQLTLFKNSSVASATHDTVLNPNETYFVVLRLRFQSGADEVALGLNPQPGRLDESGAGVTPLTTTANSDQSSVLSLQLPSLSDASGALYMDEFRVATTWAEVTPASGPPLQAEPRITGAFFSSDDFVLRGTNGVPAGMFQVLSSTNLQLPAGNWVSTATNSFDAAGNFDCTNPVPAIESARWFRLLVGDNLPPTAPSITLEPSDLTVIVGQDATFTVLATGTPPLSYQWYFSTNTGTPTAPIRLWAYPGEMPVLNFTNQPYGAANRGVLLTTTANWWEFRGLEICYAGDNAVKVEGSHQRFDQCVFHHNGDTGLQIGFGHTDENPGGQLAAFVEVVNCDSYLNYDPDSNGGDADGFAAKMHCGQGIVFTGCRAWENSDDGWDLFETDYSVVISNCWTWKSGVAQGNGNGFKLGGNGSGGDSKGTHYAYHCVAFGHKVNGFTQNSHKDGLVVINCLSFSNGSSGYNYFMEGSLNSGTQNVFKNNASVPRSGTNGGGFIEDNSPAQQNNSWNLAVTVNAADYVDLSETAAKAARNPDGSLPARFARLTFGSDLIDKGVDVGMSFNGAAPDLGPYEASP